MSSFVLQVIPLEKKRLTCFSDSCFRQNKNFQVICFWNQLALERFDQIDHKFLVRGHTYLPNERDFSYIEKRKASSRVFIPKDWEKVVHEACVKNPFTVVSMDSPKFIHFSNQTKQYTNRKKDETKQPILISKALWMNFGHTEDSRIVKKHPNQLRLKYLYQPEEPWHKVSLLKGRNKTPPSTSVVLPEKYMHGHAIKETKLAHLKSMVPFLPPKHQFYTDLIASAPRTEMVII